MNTQEEVQTHYGYRPTP